MAMFPRNSYGISFSPPPFFARLRAIGTCLFFLAASDSTCAVTVITGKRPLKRCLRQHFYLKKQTLGRKVCTASRHVKLFRMYRQTPTQPDRTSCQADPGDRKRSTTCICNPIDTKLGIVRRKSSEVCRKISRGMEGQHEGFLPTSRSRVSRRSERRTGKVFNGIACARPSRTFLPSCSSC